MGPAVRARGQTDCQSLSQLSLLALAACFLGLGLLVCLGLVSLCLGLLVSLGFGLLPAGAATARCGVQGSRTSFKDLRVSELI